MNLMDTWLDDPVLGEYEWRAFRSWIWRLRYEPGPPILHAIVDGRPLCRVFHLETWDPWIGDGRPCNNCERVAHETAKRLEASLDDVERGDPIPFEWRELRCSMNEALTPYLRTHDWGTINGRWDWQ